jgi:hypothetical protein
LSNVTIKWDIPESAPDGIYRISHRKHFAEIDTPANFATAYSGFTKSFVMGKTTYLTTTTTTTTDNGSAIIVKTAISTLFFLVLALLAI